MRFDTVAVHALKIEALCGFVLFKDMEVKKHQASIRCCCRRVKEKEGLLFPLLYMTMAPPQTSASKEDPSNTLISFKGTKDFTLVRNSDSIPTVNPNLSITHCPSNKENNITPPVAGSELQQTYRDHSVSCPVSSLKQNYSLASYGCIQKMHRLNSLDGTIRQQPYWNCTAAKHPSWFVQDFQQPRLQPLPELITISELDTLLDSLPEIHAATLCLPSSQGVCLETQEIYRATNSPGSTAISDVFISPNVSVCSVETSRGQCPKDSMVVPLGHHTRMKASGHAQDHVMSERKRRERLSQCFISLSAFIPGLKKIDKASILVEAVKYIKQMQERIKDLEEKIPMRVPVEDTNTCQFSSSKLAEVNDALDTSQDSQQDEIEVRVVGKTVFVRVHCQKRKGLLMKALSEIEKLLLEVVNANMFSVSEEILILTVGAQMEKDCRLTADDIVKALKKLFKKVI